DDGIAMRAGRPRFPALVETPGIPGNRSWLLVRTGETGSCSCDGRCRSTGKCVAIGRGVLGRSIFRGGIFVVPRLVRRVSERIVEINWREKLVVLGSVGLFRLPVVMIGRMVQGLVFRLCVIGINLRRLFLGRRSVGGESLVEFPVQAVV